MLFSLFSSLVPLPDLLSRDMGITNKYYSKAGLGCLSWLGCYEHYALGLAQIKVRNLAGDMVPGKTTSTCCTESALGGTIA